MIGWLMMAAVAHAEPDHRAHIEQARLFIRRGWYEDARKELQAAARTPDGSLEPEVWYMLAQLHLETADLEEARNAAARAHSASRDEEQLSQAATLARYLDEQFGVVEVIAPREGLAGKLEIAIDGHLLDPRQQAYLETLQDHHSGVQIYPLRLGLPVGRFHINGRPVQVQGGQEQVLALAPDEIDAPRALPFQLIEPELAAGMGLWLGEATEHLLPALDMQLAIHHPFGPMVVGVSADWAPRTFRTPLGYWTSHAGGGLGARVGVDLPGLEPLRLRAAVGYRHIWVPGVELACRREGELRICDGSGEHRLFTTSRAHTPLIELAVGRPPERPGRPLGFGLKASAEHAFGRLPSLIELEREAGGPAMRYAVEEPHRDWTAVGVRVLGYVTLSL